MPFRIVYRSLATHLFALSLLLLGLVPCYSVSMDVSLGFDGTAKPQSWTPIAVRLSNPGSGQIDGVIHVLQKNAE